MKSLFILLVFLPLASWANQIRVVNGDSQPISGATVILGSENKDGNEHMVTDVDGYFPIPADWKSLQSLTLRAQGYITTTFLDLEPRQTVLQLHREDSRQFFEVKGQAVDFQGVRRDGKVDFGLIYPALSRRDLLQFDLTSVISPETDTIKIITETVGIPSNLVLPKQTETYILPVNLEKPTFRMFVRRPGTYRVMATQGRFPLNKVVNDFQKGKSIFEVINSFDFLNAGQMEMDITGDMTAPNISVNQMRFDGSVSVQAPAIPQGYGVVSAALINQSGLYFPSDIKGLTSEKVTSLKVPANTNSAFVLSLFTQDSKSLARYKDIIDIFKEAYSPLPNFFNFMTYSLMGGLPEPEQEVPTALSLSLRPAAANVTPEFLDLVAPPQVINNQQIQLQAPRTLSSVLPVATYVVLAEIEPGSEGEGQFSAEKRFRVWENFQSGWQTQVNLPSIHLDLEKGKQYRWEVFFLGRRADFNETPGYFLDGITHVTRNQLDLQ